MNRRRFLALLSSCLGALGLVRFVPGPPLPARSELASILTSLFGSLESAAAIGRVCLEQFPAETESGRLLQALGSESRLADLWEMSPAELRGKVRALQQQDFLEGRTRKIQGWVLSQTEVRLCALAAWCLD